jgi:hypothetical protein
MPGEGAWKTAGMFKFKRTAVDTTTCMTGSGSAPSEPRLLRQRFL